jgi:hypothetical protein
VPVWPRRTGAEKRMAAAVAMRGFRGEPEVDFDNAEDEEVAFTARELLRLSLRSKENVEIENRSQVERPPFSTQRRKIPERAGFPSGFAARRCREGSRPGRCRNRRAASRWHRRRSRAWPPGRSRHRSGAPGIPDAPLGLDGFRTSASSRTRRRVRQAGRCP